MSPDESPADRPAGGTQNDPGESAGKAGGSAEQARAEEARRMRDRVHQRERAEGRAAGDAHGRTIASASVTAPRRVDPPARPAQGPERPQAGPGRGETTAPSKRPVITGVAAARLLGKESKPDDAQPGRRTPAGADHAEAATGRAERKPGGPDADAAARDAGAAQGGAAQAAPPAGKGAKGKQGTGIDGPTTHIDRDSIPADAMPDLGQVRRPAPLDARHEAEPHARTAVTVGKRRGRGPLRASMQLRSIDPWSALKVSLIVSVAMFLVWMIAVALIYVVLDGMGVWDRLNTGVTDIISDNGENTTLIGPGQVFGVAAILGIINIVLFTALSTLGAFIYNLSSDMVGGVEVTLADRD